ncbi:MAG: hypothetical protein F6K28_31275 [Microcoleus sp. SIO2G3]|nr:hypothetical protein [Microcoleus sp. SIO2G3]
MLQNSIAQVLGIVPPRPKFELFQAVRSHYITDDYQAIADTGIVIGTFYSPGMNEYGYESGWYCVVYWTALPENPGLPVPHIEELAEKHLRAIEQS